MWFGGEGMWWYDLDTIKKGYAASVVANLGRVQWPYTRRGPCERLRLKNFSSPFVCTEYLTTAKDLPIRYIDDNFDFKVFEGMTMDEFLEATKELPVERQAAMIERFQGAPAQAPEEVPFGGTEISAPSNMAAFAAEAEQVKKPKKERALKERGGVPIEKKEEKKNE